MKIVDKINLLDHGYVILNDWLGSDTTPINAARASFKKHTYEFSEADARLLTYLVKNGHLSPFRHAIIQFEMSAPLMVCRQLWRYITGTAHDEMFAWNEASYRYVSQKFEWYVPAADQWRGAPDSKKQGSKGYVEAQYTGATATHRLEKMIDQALMNYEWALDQGIAPEQARLFLPANGLYTAWYMTISLQGLVHLLAERLDSHAMWETRQYAQAMYLLARPIFSRSIKELFPDGEAIYLEKAEAAG